MRVHIPFFFYIFLFLMLFLVEAFVGAFQDPCAVEDGDEGFVGAFFGLDVAVGDAEIFHVAFAFLIFFVCDSPVDFGEFAGSSVWNVLAHEAEEDVAGGEGFCYVFHDALGVFYLAGEDEVADEDAFFEDAVGAYFVGAGLTEHLLNGGGGFFEVVRGVAVAFGCFAVHVLEVREPALDFISQESDCVDAFVAAAVVDDGDGQRVSQALEYGVCVMGGRDEVNVVGALADELLIDFFQAVDGDFYAFPHFADFVVLAVDAGEVASCEEDGAGASGSCDAGFFPVMERSSGNDGKHAAGAVADGAAVTSRALPFYFACSWADVADTHWIPFRVSPHENLFYCTTGG